MSKIQNIQIIIVSTINKKKSIVKEVKRVEFNQHIPK